MQDLPKKASSFRVTANSPWFLPFITMAVFFELVFSSGRIPFFFLSAGLAIAFLWTAKIKYRAVYTVISIFLGSALYTLIHLKDKVDAFYLVEYPLLILLIVLPGYYIIAQNKSSNSELTVFPSPKFIFLRLLPLCSGLMFLYGYFRYPEELFYIENRFLNAYFLLGGLILGLLLGIYTIVGISGRVNIRSRSKKIEEALVFCFFFFVYLILEYLLVFELTILFFILVSVPLFLWVVSQYGIRQASFVLLQITFFGLISFQLNENDLSNSIEIWMVCVFQLFMALIAIVYYFSSISQYELRYVKHQLELEREKMYQQIEQSTHQLKTQVNDIQIVEQALKESEDRYHKLATVTSEGVVIHDMGIVLDVNNSFLTILGYQRYDIIGKNLLNILVSESEVDQVLANFIDDIDKNYEFLATRKDGSQVFVEVSSKNVMFKGDMIKVFSVRDISARKEAEKQLYILQTAIEHSPGSVLITDSKGKIEYVNPAFTKITEYSKADVIGKTPGVLKSGHHPPDFYKNMWETILDGKIWSGEFLNRKKNGDLYWEDAVIGPIFGQNREITHFICNKTEVTLQKKAQETLKSSEQQFRSLAENAPIYIMKLNRDGIITYLNQHLSNHEPSQALNKEVYAFISKENHALLRAKIKSVFKKQIIESCELTGEGIDHQKLHYQARLSPLFNGVYIDSIILILQDITQSFINKLKIAESEKRYKLLSDNIVDIIWSLSKENSITFVSPSVFDVLGYKPEEIINTKAGEKLPPLPENYTLKIQNGSLPRESDSEEIKWEYCQLTKAGDEKWLETNIRPLFTADGLFDGFVGVSRDVTLRKRSELILRENEEILRGFIQESQAMILVIDKDSGHIIEANKSACKFYGFNEEEFKNLSIYDLSVDEDESTKKLLRKAVEGDPKMFASIHQVKRGLLKDVELFPTLISTLNKKFLFTIVQDVTQKRKAIDALTESESKKLALLKIIPDLILVINDEGVFKDIYTDDPSQLVLEPQKIMGKKFNQVLPPNLSFELTRLIDNAFESRDIQSYDYKYEAGNGKAVYEEIRVIVSGVKEVLVIIRDITKQKTGEIDLKKAWQEAKEANRAKSVFLANISHEIRTPINSIIGFSELLDKELTEPMHKSYINSVRSSSKTLLSLIDDLLDLSKIEARKMSLRTDEVNIRLLVDDVSRLFYVKVREKNLNFKLSIEKDVPQILLVDELRLRQIFMNLLGNAIKFTERGFVSLTIKFEVKKASSDMIIEVEDSGIGIPDKDLGRVFQAFTQQDDQDSRKFGGTGLGLTITKRLVELMNGKISLDSRANYGTKFTIQLRNVKSIEKSKVSTYNHVRSDHRLVKFYNARILVVDDVPLNRELLMNFLSKSDLELFEAENGQEAIDIVKKEMPDCILMDIRMPVLNGLETSKVIKQDEKLKHIIIIGISATPSQEYTEHQYFDEFIHKPVKLKELTKVLQKYIPYRGDAEKPAGRTDIPKLTNQEINELKKQLENLLTSHKKVLLSSSFDDYDFFSNEVQSFAQKYKLSEFSNYATDIKSFVRTFDLGGIMQHIAGFEQLVKNLESKL